MSKLSTSITMGKASVAGGANIGHNNREYLANNIDIHRLVDNITYVRWDIRDAYEELFGEALAEYNEKQTRADRKIEDYFWHIDSGSREESFYEIIVQFGDMDSAGVGTANGELAKNMLDEYIRGFNARNPNFFIVNAITHMDEQTPHTHINFIPYYTEPKKYGLSKGVSMRSALEEQGFTNISKKQNSLVAWHDSELKVMENILGRHGLARDVIGATHKHKSVPDYKEYQDWRKFPKRKKRSPEEAAFDELCALEDKISLLEVENQKLLTEKMSPWKSFYYADDNKQSFVIAELNRLNISYRETENGLEAQACYVEKIRNIEKQFKATPTSHREKLREVLDLVIMQSKDYDDVLKRLQDEQYEVKMAKYIAVKPKKADGFIRLKSLGEEYSEQAIRNRLIYKQQYEQNVDNKISTAANPDSLEVVVYKNIKHYTLVFAQGLLPVRKRNKKKPFMWTNDTELDRLSELNKKITAGVSLESLRSGMESLQKSVAVSEPRLAKLKEELDLFNKLYDTSIRCFEDGGENQSDLDYLAKHKVKADNYHRISKLIVATKVEIAELEEAISADRAELKDTSDTLTLLEKVIAGTHIHSLADGEKQRAQAEYIRNGAKPADVGEQNFVRNSTNKRA